MMITEYTFSWLRDAEEERFARELEFRRLTRERAAEQAARARQEEQVARERRAADDRQRDVRDRVSAAGATM